MVKRGKGEVIVGMIDIKEPLAIRKRGRVGQVAGGREENVRRESWTPRETPSGSTSEVLVK